MGTQGVAYDFTPRELKYILFGKKKCPACGGALEKGKDYEFRHGSDYTDKRGFFFADNEKVKHYTYYFVCKACGASYPLSELAK